MFDEVAAYLILAPIATSVVLVVVAVFWIARQRRLEAAARLGMIATRKPRGIRRSRHTPQDLT